MAVMPQRTSSRLRRVITRRRDAVSQPQVRRVAAGETELLGRVGELPRRPRANGTAASSLIGLQRWF